MEQEFETVCEDNSIKDISIWIIKYLNICKEGGAAAVKQEISQLPECKNWLQRNVETPIQMKFDIEDAEDIVGPSTSGSTTVMMEEDVEPGWTTVKTKRHK